MLTKKQIAGCEQEMLRLAIMNDTEKYNEVAYVLEDILGCTVYYDGDSVKIKGESIPSDQHYRLVPPAKEPPAAPAPELKSSQESQGAES